MKRIFFAVLVLAFLASACAPKTPTAATVTLTVSMGDTEKVFTQADLQALGALQGTFREVTYLGVPLTTLLTETGIDPASLSAVKAVASDGYSVNYDPALFTLPDTMVAYARLDGALAETEAPFTMVLPGQEGKLNARMVVKIVAIP